MTEYTPMPEQAPQLPPAMIERLRIKDKRKSDLTPLEQNRKDQPKDFFPRK